MGEKSSTSVGCFTHGVLEMNFCKDKLELVLSGRPFWRTIECTDFAGKIQRLGQILIVLLRPTVKNLSLSVMC